MEAEKIWANFSVKDAKRTRKFYTQLGFAPGKQNNDPKLAGFLFGKNNFVIHFFEQGSLNFFFSVRFFMFYYVNEN